MSDVRLNTIFQFRFGDVFPAEDIVSEWLATISLGFNDIAFVHSKLDAAFEGPAYGYFYLLRLSLGHFNEAAKFLDETEGIPEIEKYVKSLPIEVQSHYADCLARYRNRKDYLGRVRNLSAFHYPGLKIQPGARRLRLMQSILAGLADETTSFFKADTETIGDSRGLYADDIASRLFTRGSGDNDALFLHHEEIRAAITSYMRFANGAINEWLGRAIDRGVTFVRIAGSPPSYSDT